MPLIKKRAFAGLASILIPGVGQLSLGRGKRASVFLCASIIAFFVLWMVPLPETFAGLILGKLICGFIAVAAAIDVPAPAAIDWDFRYERGVIARDPAVGLFGRHRTGQSRKSSSRFSRLHYHEHCDGTYAQSEGANPY